jgi:hypothetical protein
MKTDVIFLGAGASLSAGFPTNKDLTNYIIYELSNRNKYGSGRNNLMGGRADVPERIEREWAVLAESLRKTGFLSVDEYCEHIRDNAVKVGRMKRMLRMALFDHSYFWFENNDYRTFLESLFLKGRSTELNPDFTVINFNYDGLLGTLLTDAVRERYSDKKGEQLIAVAWIHVREVQRARELERSKFLASLKGADEEKLQSIFGALDIHTNADGTGETEAHAADWHGWRVGFQIGKHGLWKVWIGPRNVTKGNPAGTSPHQLLGFKDWRNQLELDFGLRLDRVRFVREDDRSPVVTYMVESLDPPPGVLRVAFRVSDPQVTDPKSASCDSILWNPRSGYQLMVFYEH